jgi:hypothetical protein
MTEIIRHCPDCGRGRLFAQPHGATSCCPDSADQCCPEWYCVDCGTTLLMGDVLPALDSSVSPGLRDLVA